MTAPRLPSVALKVTGRRRPVQLFSAGAAIVSTGGAESMTKLRVSVVRLPQVSRASSTKRCGPSAMIGVPERYGAPSRVAVTVPRLASVAVQLTLAGAAVQVLAAGAVTVTTGGAESTVKARLSLLTLPQVSRASSTKRCGPSVTIGVPDR